MSTLYIGVDPGNSGAIAFKDSLLGEAWSVKCSETDRDIIDALKEAVEPYDACFAIIEKVHSSPQMGVKSAFTFGESFGKLQMLLLACSVPFDYVTPAKWQGDMKCRTKGDKNVTKKAAQRLFPEVKVTHANADALLLAEYAQRNLCRKLDIPFFH